MWFNRIIRFILYECSCLNLLQDLSNLREDAGCAGGNSGPLPWSNPWQYNHSEKHWPMVSTYQETVMATTELGFWSSLDLFGNYFGKLSWNYVLLNGPTRKSPCLNWHDCEFFPPTVRWHGLCELHGDEGRRRPGVSFLVLYPAGPQLGLDSHLLRLSQCEGRLLWDLSALDCRRCDRRQFFSCE